MTAAMVGLCLLLWVATLTAALSSSAYSDSGTTDTQAMVSDLSPPLASLCRVSVGG